MPRCPSRLLLVVVVVVAAAVAVAAVRRDSPTSVGDNNDKMPAWAAQMEARIGGQIKQVDGKIEQLGEQLGGEIKQLGDEVKQLRDDILDGPTTRVRMCLSSTVAHDDAGSIFSQGLVPLTASSLI
jgi:hypothetical protein